MQCLRLQNFVVLTNSVYITDSCTSSHSVGLYGVLRCVDQGVVLNLLVGPGHLLKDLLRERMACVMKCESGW